MSESALAKREERIARREMAMRNRAVLEKAHHQVGMMAAKQKGILRQAAEQPLTDSLAEFGGTIAEAAIKSQFATAHPYVGPIALLAEFASLMKYRKSGKDEYRTIASLARGMQARTRVELADNTVTSIFAAVKKV